MRIQGFARNRMTSASGFTWVAREPRLMVGAKGRASAQRLIEYHLLERFHNSRSISSMVQGGIFLRKMPLDGSGFGVQQLWNRYTRCFQGKKRATSRSLFVQLSSRNEQFCSSPAPASL